jgi:hypothetical protein
VKRLALWALLVASLSANLAIAAVAMRQQTVSSSEPHLFSRVALDADQRARISELRSRIMARRDEHARRIAGLRKELASAIMQEPDSHARVQSILRSIVESQAGLQQAVVEHVIATRAVLRPDQRPAFEQMVTEHMTSGGPMQCGLGATSGERKSMPSPGDE